MRKNRIYLLVVIILAVLAAFHYFSRSVSSTLKKGETSFAVDDTANITRIFMADKKGHSVMLVRDSLDGWKANKEFDVRSDAIDILLKTMLNVEVMEPVAKAGRDNIIKRLASTGVKVEIYQNVYRVDLFGMIKLFPREKLTRVYYVGSETQDNLGTFMLLEGAENPYITYLPGFRGFISVRYSPRLGDWRDHAIFRQRINEIRSVRLEFLETPGLSLQVDNLDDRNFQLKGLYNGTRINDYDTTKMLDFITSFANINYELLVEEMDIKVVDSIKSSPPFHRVTLVDKKGRSHVVTTFHRANPGGPFDDNGNRVYFDRDRMYALVNDNRDFVVVQFFVFDNILKPLDYFLKSPTGESRE